MGRPSNEDPSRRAAPVAGPSKRALRMLASALAGGGLTAAGLVALVGPALGAESTPIGTPGDGTLGSGQAPGVPEAAGAGQPGQSSAEQPPSTTTTTAPTTTTTAPTTPTTAPTATTTAPTPTTTAPASSTTVPIGDPSNPSAADRPAPPPEAPKVVLQRKQSPSGAKRPKRSGSVTGQKPSASAKEGNGGTPSGPGNVAPAPGIIAAQAGAFPSEPA